ncbi:zeta toxin family protein [Treponema sp. UBA753]|uniref:zeta toxin family protein n=1 Tax=Treponema sp. UBA753 TaxID=1947747 RepID=UPI0025EFB088|nr:zeta toxin family protein [Treponema sp. UBA753]
MNPFLEAEVSPEGFVLGGQPGAGKTTLTNMLSARLNKNIISISGDDFRPYHPHFEEIQNLYKEESPPPKKIHIEIFRTNDRSAYRQGCI